MFCAPGPVFDCTEGVVSRFQFLRSRTHFRRYRGRRVPVSCSALSDRLLAVPTMSGAIFMFCAPGPVFGGSDAVGSRFHVLRYWTHFWRYRGRRVQFSCFALQDPFSAVLIASGPVFMFCAPGLIFGGTEGVGSRFRRHGGLRVPFSCLALPDSFSVVPRASCPILMFYAPGPVFGGTDASRPVFIFCAPGPFFGRIDRVGSRFHVLRSWTHFRRYHGHRVPFYVLHSRTRFRRYQRRRVPI
jgi:hypothetical protein